jgi:superfamily II DNA or RNA helicase
LLNEAQRLGQLLSQGERFRKRRQEKEKAASPASVTARKKKETKMQKTEMKVTAKAELVNAPGEVLQKIREALTLDNPKYLDAQKHGRWTGHLEPRIYLFSDIEDGISFPRGFARQALGMLAKYGIKPEIEDCRRELEPIELEFQGTLRGYQEQAVEDVRKRHFGILDCSTGGGKTIMALAIIAARRQPCLILVHTKELLHQWTDRIRSFLGIEPGLIGDGKYDLQPLTVGLVHTVRKHLDELPLHFGHIVVDECHRTPATMFTEAVQAFDAKYMLGLSATAYRRDGLTKLIYMTLGDRVHKVDPAILKANGAVLAPEVVHRETSFRYPYNEDYPAMITSLTEDPKRNQQIAADVIRQAQNRPGTALVVSDRVAHCESLRGLIGAAGVNVHVLTGQCSKAQREAVVEAVQAGQADVLISTLQLLGEGFDCSGLSSLFLATPIKFKGRLLQVVGRILRPGDGKRPLVFDYVDENQPVLKAQAKSRGKALEEIAA